MRPLSAAVLNGSSSIAYERSRSPSFLERAAAEGEALDECRAAGLDASHASISGPVGPRVTRGGRDGRLQSGINFASQDYLSLGTHQRLAEAACRAAHRHGVHCAGPPSLAGNCDISLAFESELAAFLGMRDATLFPSGWTAGYGVITALVRGSDHVVIDEHASRGLQEGARHATRRLTRARHLDVDDVEATLRTIRSYDPQGGILLVTEALFPLQSDWPDIAALQAMATRWGATLLVDCAHDLGAMGATGRGVLETQDMVGRVDILVGAFSKTFASSGGFVACNEPRLKVRLRTACGPSAFTSALAPLQIAVLREALAIVDGEEGAQRRDRLARNALSVRRRLSDAGFDVRGKPSPLVPVVLGPRDISRLTTRETHERGAFANLVETDAGQRRLCRWRLAVMADHTQEDVEAFVERAAEGRHAATRILAQYNELLYQEAAPA